MAAAPTGLFLIFTVFTAPLFSMVSSTVWGGGYTQQASAQEQSSTPASQPSPTLPFTPFSLQQQQEQEAAVSENTERKAGGEQQDPGLPPPPSQPTNDTGTIPGGEGGVPGGNVVVAPEPGGIAPPPTTEGVPLAVEIIPNATQVVAPATIEAGSNVTGGTGPYSYRWELLGGRFTLEYFEPQIVLMFPIPGMYTLVLNVTDSSGRIGSDSVQITVGGLELPPSDDVGEVVVPPSTEGGGGVLLPPETGQEGEGGQLIQEPRVPPPSLLLANDTGTGAAATTTTLATNDTLGREGEELPAEDQAQVLRESPTATEETAPPSTTDGGQTAFRPTPQPIPYPNEPTEEPIQEPGAPGASEPPLRVEAIANVTEAYAPATIRLDANITGGAPPYSYNWYVPGFGVIDQDRSITQMFFEPGTFNYILTVTDSRGKVLNDNVPIVIRERLPPGVRGGGGVVAPEPGGIAPPESPIQEPRVPPPTVPEGEGGGDTGRGPQGGVTVEEGGGPIEPGTPPPTVGGGGGGITITPGGEIRIIPYPESGFVGDHFEIRTYARDDVTVSSGFVDHCYNYYPESGQCYPSNKIEYVQKPCAANWWEFAPPGYHWLPGDCIVFTYLAPGTYYVAAGIYDRYTGEVTFDNLARITVRERSQGGSAVAPEPGGLGLPERGGPPLPTAPEPGGVAPPDEGGGESAVAPEPGGVAPPPQEPIQPEGQLT